MSEAKNILRRFLRENSLISSLGEIGNLREIGEGGNGLVYEGALYDMKIAVKFLVNAEKHKLIRFKAEYLNVVLLPSNKYVVKPLSYEEFKISDVSYSAILLKKGRDSEKRLYSI